MSHPEWMLDKRVVARYLKKGLVQPSDVEKVLKALPDTADNAEYISIPMGEEMDDDDDAETASTTANDESE